MRDELADRYALAVITRIIDYACGRERNVKWTRRETGRTRFHPPLIFCLERGGGRKLIVLDG